MINENLAIILVILARLAINISCQCQCLSPNMIGN
jgi:hypothetical protein